MGVINMKQFKENKYNEMGYEKDLTIIKCELQAAIEASAVMRVLNPISKTIADIKQNKKTITISFREKNDKFKKIVKDYGYRWDSIWVKNISFKTENIEDRIAEIGHSLLFAGFSVRIMNSVIRKKVVDGNFKQEHTRWISILCDKPNYFYISWNYLDNMYDAAKQITSSVYHKPGILVSIEHFEEVLDFAETYKFRFSQTAEKLIERGKLNESIATIVLLQEKTKVTLPQLNRNQKLEIPLKVEVLNEFKD